MTHNEALERRLAEMFDGHAWHGPALLTTLRDLTPAQAAATPIAGAHSIWALALHLDTWQRVVARRLAGDDSPVGDAENFPPVPPPDSTAWAEHTSLRDRNPACDRGTLRTQAGQVDPRPERSTLEHRVMHAGLERFVHHGLETPPRTPSPTEVIPDDPSERVRQGECRQHGNGA